MLANPLNQALKQGQHSIGYDQSGDPLNRGILGLTNYLKWGYALFTDAKSSVRISTLFYQECPGAQQMRLFLRPKSSMVGLFRALQRAVPLGGSTNLLKSATHGLVPGNGSSQTNQEDTTMSSLSVFSQEIRTADGLYSLNDLHKASGYKAKHQPNRFIRLTQTQDLIQEIAKYPDMGILPVQQKRGVNGGTYACRALVLTYASWISPKFHLHVLRSYDQIDQDKLKQPCEAPSAPVMSEKDIHANQRNDTAIKH